MENNRKEMMELSFTVHTFEDSKLDSLREILLNLRWNFIKVTKLGESSFLLTVEDAEMLDMLNSDDL